MDFVFIIIFCDLFVPCNSKVLHSVLCHRISLGILCRILSLDDRHERSKRRRRRRTVGKGGFSFGPADKTDVELQTHWYFFAKKGQKLSIFECKKDDRHERSKRRRRRTVGKGGFSFGPAYKTDVKLQTHWYFFSRLFIQKSHT